MADYDGSVRIATKITTKDAKESLASLEWKIKNSAKVMDGLCAKMDALKGQKIPTEQYKKLENDLAAAKKELDKLVEEQNKLESIGITFGSAWDTLNEKVAKASDSVDAIKAKMQQLVDAGKGFTLGENTAQYQELENQLKAEEAAVAQWAAHYKKLAGSVTERFAQMRQSAKKAFTAIAGDTKKTGGLFSAFSSRLKGIALSLLIFKWISKGFNAMVAGMKKGFENLAGYSNSYANSIQSMKNAMATLGNQFAAAFAPIVQMVIPWLNQLIGALTTAMSYVAQFTAALTGVGTFTRAKKIQDGYNKSLDGTAGAAKKAAGALAKFDDLDVLQKKDNGAAEMLPADMFEEVPVAPKFKKWLDGIREALKPILAYINELKDIFAEGFWDGLGDFEGRISAIKKSAASIAESLSGIFSDPAVLSSADGWAKSVIYMLGSLAGSMASAGITYAAAITGGMAKYLEENSGRVKEYLVSVFDISAEVDTLLAELFKSIAYVYEAFAGENGQTLVSNLIGIYADAFMGIEELVFKLSRDLSSVIVTPFSENKEVFRAALDGWIGVLSEVTGTIKGAIDETLGGLNRMYDEHFKPFFDSVAAGLSELAARFMEFWGGYMQPILDGWAQKFDELWDAHLGTAVNGAIRLLGSLADMFKVLFENVLKPYWAWMIDNAFPILATALDGIVTHVINVFAIISTIAAAAVESLKSVADYIVGAFGDDIEGAAETLGEELLAVGENLIEGLKSGIANAVGSVYGTITRIAEKIVEIYKDIFDISSPSKVMEEIGGYLIEGLKNGIVNMWNTVKDAVGNVASGVIDKFKDILGIHSPSTVMEENGAYMMEGLENGISSGINSVYALFSPDTWYELGTQMFASLMTAVEEFKALWLESFTIWQEENLEMFFGYDMWYEQWANLMTAYNDVNAEFLTEWSSNINAWWKDMVMPFFEVSKWQQFGTNMKNGILLGFKSIVGMIAGVLNHIITLFNSGYAQLQDAMNSLIDDYNAKAAVMGTPQLSGVSYSPMPMLKVPELASGAVIRGGNPFLAILGDQPAGQTNIETPANLIKDMVKQGMAEAGYGRGEAVPVTINLNYDGETFARLSLDDIMAEAARQGYNVDLLGWT